MTYDLWYWAEIPGRGEFVRLALEAGGISYRDRAREEGSKALIKDMEARRPRPFAPPYLVAGDLVIAQTAHILAWLGDRHGLAPRKEALSLAADGPSFADPTKTAKYKDVIEFKNDGHRILTSHVLGEDGKWTQFMTAHYRRTE